MKEMSLGRERGSKAKRGANNRRSGIEGVAYSVGANAVKGTELQPLNPDHPASAVGPGTQDKAVTLAKRRRLKDFFQYPSTIGILKCNVPIAHHCS